MKQIAAYLKRIKELRSQRGFTMIELLIVISILGILAVAVLSAINPLEQINRGRDTGSRSDAEQLIGAIERFNAFQGYFPWDLNDGVDATAVIDGTDAVLADSSWVVDGDADCTVLNRLGEGTDCPTGAAELKQSFVAKISGLSAERGLYVYKADAEPTTNMYVCFQPQSEAFKQEAVERCDSAVALPGDFPTAFACPDDGNGATDPTEVYSCLP